MKVRFDAISLASSMISGAGIPVISWAQRELFACPSLSPSK